MSFLFGGGGGDGGAAQKQLENQEKQIAKQEAAQLTEKTEMAQREQAGMRARRRGGVRSLLSAARMDSELGVQDSTKLGGGS